MSRQNQDHQKSAVALMLSFAAASVDIVSYLSAYHTFTAHMSGNTIRLGNALSTGNGAEAALAAMVLILFVCGSLLGRVLIEIGSRHKIRSIASWTFGIEAALLAIVASQILGGFVPEPGPRYPKIMLALLASAMGLQTATITRVGALTVHTTFVTGMLNKLSQLFSQVLFDTYDLAVAGSTSVEGHRTKTLRSALFIFSIWCSYATGAIAGTWLYSRWHLHGLYLPVALLCLAICVDQVVPLSVEEEKDQSER